MGKTVTVKARGLFLNPNDIGDVPDGALSRATNVVVSRDGIIETRRGTEVADPLAIRRLGHYGTALIGWAANTLYRSTDNGDTWTAYAGSYPEPSGARMRFVEASGNLYFNASNGIWRLDSLTGTPELAGCFPGMDCQAVIATPSVVDVDGTGVAPDSQTAYRILFAKRDANNNVIFGAPTQRAVVTNTSIVVPSGGVSTDASASPVVTVTFNGHGFTSGQKVYRNPRGSNEEVDADNIPRFTDGLVGPITVVDSDTFTYVDANASPSYTSNAPCVYANGYRDVLVSASLPPGIPTGTDYFWQGYKSLSSSGSDVDPGDEEGLTYEGTIPVPRTISTLARDGGVVTAVTTAPHGYTPGTVVALPTGLAGTVAKVIAAVAGFPSAAASSPDGAAWTAQVSAGSPRGPLMYGGATGSERFMAPGLDCAVVSADGATWTNPAAKDGAHVTVHYQVAYGAGVWVLAGSANSTLVIFVSSDHGATWAKATVGTGGNPIPGGSTYAPGNAFVVWDGAKFVVGCLWTIGGVKSFITVESPTGGLADWDFFSHGSSGAVIAPPGPAAFDGTKIVALSGIDVLANSGQFTRTGGAWSVGGIVGTIHNSRVGGVHFQNGMWWCLGRTTGLTGAVASSADGITWSLLSGVGDATGNIGICWDGSQYVMCAGYTAAASSIYTSPDGVAWTAHATAAGSYYGIASANLDNTILAGTYTITSVPDATSFTFASVAPDRAAAGAAQACTPVAVGFLDTVPDSFLGAALYTSPGQETILQQNDRPVPCRDMARYRNFIFSAAPTPLTSAPISLISIGGVTGLRAGDTVTINGATATASATENTQASVGPLTFKVYNSTDRTPSQNIQDTATSLMRVVNRNSTSFQATLVDTTTVEGVPGQMTIRTLVSGLTTTFAYTSTAGGTPWSPALGVSVPAKTVVNELRWAKANQPDAAPELNSIRVGATDKAIVRIVATRSSLFIFKEDGIHQLTGAVPPFQTDPFDLTTDIVGAETAVALDNQVFLLTQNGIQKVSDTGTTLISRPIDPPLQDLLDPTHRSTVKSVAFGIGDNADHKYYLWLPVAAGDTYARQAYVYDYFTDAFFHRDDPAYCGDTTLDDRLILGTDLGVERERKTLTSADLIDNAGVAISTVVQWVPKFGQDPTSLAHFQEIVLMFRRVYFDVAYLDFSTSLAGGPVYTIALDGSAYGLAAGGTDQFMLRALVPPECRRAGLLNVAFRHAVAGAPMQIQGLAVSFNPGPSRVGR